jgi:hypothetical protein
MVYMRVSTLLPQRRESTLHDDLFSFDKDDEYSNNAMLVEQGVSAVLESESETSHDTQTRVRKKTSLAESKGLPDRKFLGGTASVHQDIGTSQLEIIYASRLNETDLERVQDNFPIYLESGQPRLNSCVACT